MIEIYQLKNNFDKEEFEDIAEIEDYLNSARPELEELSYKEIISVWAELGKILIHDKKIIEEEGVIFLAKWLRDKNLENFLLDNLRISNLDDLQIELKEGGFMSPSPRGIIVQWSAGNTLTMPIFSLFQTSVTKNSTVLRASRRNLNFVLQVLKLFKKIDVKSAEKVLKNIVITYFPHEYVTGHEIISKIADCKIIWGDSAAINFIKSLPEKENCETIIFGPKYSIAAIEDNEADFDRIAEDIVLFDQMACSSPQMLFVEKGDLEETGKKLAESLKKACAKHPKRAIREDIAAKIINKRMEYLLNPELSVFSSKENDWTILVGGEFRMEEAVQSRTIFIKRAPFLEDIRKMISQKIQTIVLDTKDKKRREKLAKAYSSRGAARVVKPGEANNYMAPWDGLLVLDRITRWCFHD